MEDYAIKFEHVSKIYKLKKKNVFITPGVIFYRDSKNGDYFFRIGFSQVSKDKIIEGIGLIKEEL